MPPILPHYFKELINQKDNIIPSIESTAPSEGPINRFLESVDVKTLLAEIENMAGEKNFPSLHSLSAEQLRNEFMKKQEALKKLFLLLRDKNFVDQLKNPRETLALIKSIVQKWLTRNQALTFYATERFSNPMLEKDRQKTSRLLSRVTIIQQENWGNLTEAQFERIHQNRLSEKPSKEHLEESQSLAEMTLKQIETIEKNLPLQPKPDDNNKQFPSP